MENEKKEHDYSDPNFEPQNAQEALEVVRALREDLKLSQFMIVQEDGKEITYPNSSEGKSQQAKIEELIERYGKEQIFIDYLTGEKVDENLQARIERQKRIESQKKFIKDLERESRRAEQKLRQAREHLRKLEEE